MDAMENMGIFGTPYSAIVSISVSNGYGANFCL
jgi:hypothetical protein